MSITGNTKKTAGAALPSLELTNQSQTIESVRPGESKRQNPIASLREAKPSPAHRTSFLPGVKFHHPVYGAPYNCVFHCASVPGRTDLGMYQEDIRADDTCYDHLDWQPEEIAQ